MIFANSEYWPIFVNKDYIEILKNKIFAAENNLKFLNLIIEKIWILKSPIQIQYEFI